MKTRRVRFALKSHSKSVRRKQRQAIKKARAYATHTQHVSPTMSCTLFVQLTVALFLAAALFCGTEIELFHSLAKCTNYLLQLNTCERVCGTEKSTDGCVWAECEMCQIDVKSMKFHALQVWTYVRRTFAGYVPFCNRRRAHLNRICLELFSPMHTRQR